MKPILAIENLMIESEFDRDEATGAAKRIVDRVSLTLQPGEVLGLIGESGAGKTTLGLSALGYVRPGMRIAGGKVIFGDEDLVALDPNKVRALRGQRIAYIAQSAAASFNPALRLQRQVGETAVRHGVMSWRKAAERSRDIFRELSLPMPDVFGQRFPHQVSGGQLQRAMAAMAMTCNPSLLVLDEPTTALDVTTQIEVLAALRKLIRSHNTAALYISHDLAVIAQIADRVLVLRHGKEVEEGRINEVLAQPKETYTRELLAVRAADSTVAFREGLPPSAEAPVLSLRNVSASYRSRAKVVSDVSLDVQRGETLAVVGESGSGKTSLARVVCGMLAPEAGSITFRGAPLPATIGKRSRDELRRIQMIYQMPDVALNPRHSVGKTIGRPIAFYHGRAVEDVRAGVIELLRLVDLGPHLIDRLPRELSGGQKQRVCIARALAANPDLLVCDEITSALDSLVAEGILGLLRRLQEELGLAILFITHDLGLVRRTANRMVVMLQGEVVAAGPVQQIYSPPHHPYTEKLLSSVPEMRVGWLDKVLAGRPAADRGLPGGGGL